MSSNQLRQPESQDTTSRKLIKMINGSRISQAVYVMAKLALADQLAEGAKSGEQLAQKLDVDVKRLSHLMGVLTALDLVSVDQNGDYELTTLGSLLRSNTPDSLRGTILTLGSIVYQAWGNLLYSIESGQAAFDDMFQASFYDYLAQNAEANTLFNMWMAETTHKRVIPALEAYDLSKYSFVVDVGGGTGTLTVLLLKQYPKLQAILFDQEHVVSEAEEVLAPVAERCQVIGGSFFESVPVGGELYLLSGILFNWDDARALQILKNCRAAMRNSAKLLIVDAVLPTQGTSARHFLVSLNLLVLSGHPMRTKEEYYQLLSEAGFQDIRLIPTKGKYSLIEARPHTNTPDQGAI